MNDFLLNNKEFIKKNNRVITAICLAIFVIFYNFIWLNKTYTMSEGWTEFYNALLSEGKIPYRDFYYYLPPLNLFIDYLIWKASFGYVIIFRLWRLCERLILIELMYYLLAKKIHPYFAGLSGILSCVLYSANVFDIRGDYNQSVVLLVVLVTIVLNKYVEKIGTKKRFKFSFIVGILGGLMFMEKQTVVVAAFVGYLILLLILVINKYEKQPISLLLSIILGAVIPLSIFAIYFFYTGSLGDFIYQVFIDVSSKGSIYNIIITKLFDLFKAYIYEVIAIILVILGKITKNTNKKIQFLFIVFAFSILSFKYFQMVSQTFSVLTKYIVGVLIILQMVMIALGHYTNRIKYFFLLDIVFTFIICMLNPLNITNIIHEKIALFSFLTSILSILFCVVVIWIIYHLRNCRNEELDLFGLILAFSSFVVGYSSLMANGDSNVSTMSAALIIPTCIYFLYRRKQYDGNNVRTILLAVSVPIVLSICISQKLICPYSWWGDTEASFFDKTEESNINALKGFKFSKEEIERYDKLNEVITANTDDNSVIWGFPYVKVYNLFQNNYNMSGFVPVIFYDTCADDYAEEEAILLSKCPPDIVVWQDIPSCIETHESVYRDGNELGQRKIIEWFTSVKDDKYTLIGQVDKIFVYKLIDDSSVISQTYIKSKYAANDTATKELKLNGLGCKSIPYEIASYEDLDYLRRMVNNGNTYDGVYFKQTDNIQLPDGMNWEPIGDDESDGFSGIYDGNGYTIKNLYMLSTNDEDLSLFGKVDGTVYNLAVEGAWIGGRNVALIANSGSGNILNCYANGILYGYNCSGITYNVSGNVSNNVAIVTVEKGNANGIIGAYSEKLENNFSNISDISLQDSGLIIDKNSVKILNEYVDKYNNGQNEFTLLHWTDDGGIPHLTSE